MQSAEGSGPLKVSWYCVAFIDILGQSENLVKFTDIPSDEDGDEKRQAFIELCRQTYGRVIGFRKNVERGFETMLDPTRVTSSVPEQFHNWWRQLVSFEIRIDRLSDGFAIYLPMAADKLYLIPYAIKVMLNVVALAQLRSFAAGYSIRGGIDVGHGAILHDGMLYGPAVYSAYNLESRVAGYPRVVVGDHAVHYMESAKRVAIGDINPSWNIQYPELYVQITRHAAEECIGSLCEDCDGRPVVDYLSERYVAAAGGRETVDPLVKLAWQFIVSESERFSEERNTKLALRFASLREYFLSRVPRLADDALGDSGSE